MPQNPITPRPGGSSSLLNVSATTVVKTTGGTLYRVSVTTAGSTVGNVYDNNATGSGNTAANLIGVVPNTVGVYLFEFPCFTGITYVPGTGQVASFSFS